MNMLKILIATSKQENELWNWAESKKILARLFEYLARIG